MTSNQLYFWGNSWLVICLCLTPRLYTLTNSLFCKLFCELFFRAVYSNINKNYTPLLNPPLIGRWCRSLLWCGSGTASDYIQSEHWNLIWVLCVNLMVRGPFSLLILEVKHILWGHCLQIYNLNFPWQQPLLCASKQGGSKRCVLVVWLKISKAKEEEEENIGCVNMPSAPRAPSTITYGMSCISIYTGW